LTLRNAEILSCCSPKHREEAAILAENDDFLSCDKRKDGNFLNPLHILAYCDKLKVFEYDAHCPSINQAFIINILE
jgi:hypothetical protein